MKRKILCVLCVFIPMLLTGCANYGSIENTLERVEIENTLPELSKKEYKSVSDADDVIYEQQLAMCDMYAQSYEKTYYQQFLGDSIRLREDRVANICNDFRRKLNEEISLAFFANIYDIVEDCDDVINKEAFLNKVNNDVLGFYDAYADYMNADDSEEELCNILVNYSQRRNILALSFLERHKQETYEAATYVIENNAEADEDIRFYLNKNNGIVTALNDVYDGVPSMYAERISRATAKISENLINSLQSLSEKEKLALMAKMNLSTPSPTPRVTATPSPSASPLPSPSHTQPAVTQPPVRTAVPATAAPVHEPVITAVPTTVPTSVPIIVNDEKENASEGTQTNDDRPSYSFSVD